MIPTRVDPRRSLGARGVRTQPRGRALSEPAADVCDTTEVGRYLWWSARRHDRVFDGYEALHRWSAEQPSDFWNSVAEFFALRRSSGARASIESGECAAHLDGVANFASCALRAGSSAAVLSRASDGSWRRVERAALRDLVARTVRGLRDVGVRPGDRVLGWLPNSVDAVVVFLASAAVGAIWVSWDPSDDDSGAWEWAEALEPVVLVTDVDPHRARAVAMAIPSLLAHVHRRSFLDRLPGEMPWCEFIGGPAGPLVVEPVSSTDPLVSVVVPDTAGGPSVTVLHGHAGAVLDQARCHGLAWDLAPGARLLLPASTSSKDWCTLVGGLVVGATLVLLPEREVRLSPGLLWRTASETGVSVVAAHRSLIVDASRDFDRADPVPSLKQVVVLDSTLPCSTEDRLRDRIEQPVLLNPGAGSAAGLTPLVHGGPLQPAWSGRIAGPALGVCPTVLGRTGTELVGRPGDLVVTGTAPGLPVGMSRDPGGRRFRDRFFHHGPQVWSAEMTAVRFGDDTWAVDPQTMTARPSQVEDNHNHRES